MKVTRTKVVPAKPAQAERTEKYQVDICDVCAKHLRQTECDICGRDACRSCSCYCSVYSSDDTTVCATCRELWDTVYKAQIAAIEMAADEAIAKMRAAWKAESITEQALNAAEPKGGSPGES